MFKLLKKTEDVQGCGNKSNEIANDTSTKGKYNSISCTLIE